VLDVPVGYGYKSFETTQRLTNVFNYGFGDLAIDDHYIGTTKVESFRDTQIDLPVFSSNATSLSNWRRGEDTSTGPVYEYPANTESVDGGELHRNLAGLRNVAVLTSSSSTTPSVEHADWQNGAFTKALVEGLSGRADYTKDGAISINELDTWVADRVKQLTKNQQTPTTTKPNTVPDFPVAAVR
jgi:hypothetical protein